MRLNRNGFAAAAALVGLTTVTTSLEAQRGRTPSQPARQAPAAPTPIRFASPVMDSLRPTDATIGGRGAFRVFRFEARTDKRYIITMDAPDFDAYVWVAQQVGVLTDAIASDDDGGEGSNARLRFNPPTNGSYYLVAQSLSTDGAGLYALQVVEQDPPPPAVARAIEAGQTISGELTAESPVLEGDGDQSFDAFTIRGSGQRVRIQMNSSDFDAYLRIFRVVGGLEEQVASDDDSGGETNARVNLTLDGEYRIIASALSSGERGSYELSVTDAPVVPVVQRPITVGETVSNELSSSDPELDNGGFFHEYVVTAAAGDAFRITLRSGEFDSYLRWGTKDGEVFTEIASDDDSGGELDSMLEVRVDRAGTYVIRVSALGSGSVGPYQVTLERGN